MVVSYIELHVSEEVTTATEVGDTYVPANGATLQIERFIADSVSSLNSVCCLYWDFGEAGEEILWSSKGDVDIKDLNIAVTGCDGTKKLTACCANGDAEDLIMTVHVVVRVET